jgi:para-aminobenzoate synthetase component 1
MTTRTVVANKKGILCKLHYKKIHTLVNLPALSERFAHLGGVSILGGNPAKKDADRFSYWAAWPREIFEFRAGELDPFGKLQQALAKYKLQEDPRPRTQDSRPKLPKGIFLGGWIGYFSYELGRYIEELPETTIDDLQMPLIRLCFYDRVVCYDHLKNNFWLIALQLPGDIEKPQEKLKILERLLAESQQIFVPPPVAANLEAIDLSQIRCNMEADFYLQMVEKIKRYIYDGDVYQVNFSQRFECDYDSRAIDLFHWQNHYNPSPYAAYIDGDSFTIVSASPEMFITIEQGEIRTKPIKGTRPRISETTQARAVVFDLLPRLATKVAEAGKKTLGQAKQINERNFNELLYSEKERAELNMIIDLERNDVAKICEYGTRKVIQPRTIETYPTVFHAVATVGGQLRKEITFCDVLKAMFPGGSITGAPKIRSMEIIDETEPTARGVYTGSIGFIGIDGNVCLNIAIRTIIIKDQKAFAQVGGGIVADSNAEAEWEETITKARALLAGIRAVSRASSPEW